MLSTLRKNLILIYYIFFGFILLQPANAFQQATTTSLVGTPPQTSAYLFVYFIGNKIGEEQIRFALSDDGFNYKALNDNQPVVNSKKISLSGGVRDPHILRCEDGKTF